MNKDNLLPILYINILVLVFTVLIYGSFFHQTSIRDNEDVGGVNQRLIISKTCDYNFILLIPTNQPSEIIELDYCNNSIFNNK